MSKAMAVAGSLRSLPSIMAGGRILTADAGFIQIADGIGCLITHGAGLHSITVVGSSTQRLAGAGGLTASGARHGSVGDTTGITAAGRRSRHAPDSLPASASHSVATPRDTIFPSASAPIIFDSFAPAISWIATWLATFCHATILRGFLTTQSPRPGLIPITTESQTTGFPVSMWRQRFTAISSPLRCTMSRPLLVSAFANALNAMAEPSPCSGRTCSKEHPQGLPQSRAKIRFKRITATSVQDLKTVHDSHLFNLNLRRPLRHKLHFQRALKRLFAPVNR
jgi:hypothetical protein